MRVFNGNDKKKIVLYHRIYGINGEKCLMGLNGINCDDYEENREIKYFRYKYIRTCFRF